MVKKTALLKGFRATPRGDAFVLLLIYPDVLGDSESRREYGSNEFLY